MNGRRQTLKRIALSGLLFCPDAARAQRADDNVTASADDAFGKQVGNESVGLYSSNNARGFSPQQAGNMRIEGLYYDQQGLFGRRLQRSQTMRIGLSAQSYPFPAPTGIADITLVMPNGKNVVSVAQQVQVPFGAMLTQADFLTPLVDGKLGAAGGIVYQGGRSDFRGKNPMLSIGTVLRWTPRDDLEIIPFVYSNQVFGADVQPAILPGGDYLPARFDRTVFFGQTWAERRANDRTLGLIMRGNPLENWRLQFGLFNSTQIRPENYSILYRSVQPDGAANLDIIGSPRHQSAGTSGEIRLSGVFTDGQFRHTVHIASRGRDTHRLFGGTNTVAFGAANIGVYRALTEPVFNYGVRDKDVVRQITPGVSYVGQWADVGEFSVGLQRSLYRRRFGPENVTPASTSSKPWLYNGTLALYPIETIAVYGSYTRGIEEFGTAPDNAVNRGQPVPAALTKQVDAGIRYRIQPGLSLVAGLFEVTKPYFDRNQANIYTDVGSLRYRGIETSLTGKLTPEVTVVAGAVLLQARVSGLSVDRGLIGNMPPGRPPATYLLNLQYAPPALRGLTVDAQMDIDKSHYANRANSFRIPTAATLNIGSRYAFSLSGNRFSLRTQITNLLNGYGWTANGSSGQVAPTAPRQYTLRIAADF